MCVCVCIYIYIYIHTHIYTHYPPSSPLPSKCMNSLNSRWKHLIKSTLPVSLTWSFAGAFRLQPGHPLSTAVYTAVPGIPSLCVILDHCPASNTPTMSCHQK